MQEQNITKPSLSRFDRAIADMATRRQQIEALQVALAAAHDTEVDGPRASDKANTPISREVANLRRTLTGMTEHLVALATQLEVVLQREEALWNTLCDGLDQAMWQVDELQAAIDSIRGTSVAHQRISAADSVDKALSPKKQLDYQEYQRLIHRIREIASNTIPIDATVLVVSRGDEELLKLGGRPAWHFPRLESGVYAGHYPTDSAEAITHLEDLRAKGAEYLLFPRTACWWLDHYVEFKQHLERRYRLVLRQDDACQIFRLIERASEHVPSPTDGKHLAYQLCLRQIREIVASVLPHDATILVVSKGDEALLQLGGRRASHFPRLENGVYAGHNPADSAAAIAQIEALRAEGASYLLFPRTAFWWLDHYLEFKRHLQRRYRRVVWQEHVCLIFALDTENNN